MSTPPSQTQPELTVISFVDIPSSQPGRIGKTDRLVSYELDPLHRFQVVLPKEAATEAAVDAAIRADFNQIKSMIGRKIRL